MARQNLFRHAVPIQLAGSRRDWIVWLQLLGLLALLIPLFIGLQAMIAWGDAPRTEVVVVPETVPVIVEVPVEVPVERVIERVIYVPAESTPDTAAAPATGATPSSGQ